MTCFRCLLASLCLLQLSSVMAEPSVDISITPPTVVRLGDVVRVTCFVSGLGREDFVFRMRLFCPIVTGSTSCFQNCKPTCQPGTGCSETQTKLMSSVRCQTFKDTTSRKFSYEFPYNAQQYSGNYMCQYYGKNSARILLPKPITPKPKPKPPATPKNVEQVTMPPKTRPPKTPPKKEPVDKTPETPTKKPAKPPACGENGENCGIPYRIGGDSTQSLLFILLLVFFVISGFTNAIFCIRCVLINKYAQDPRRLQRMGCCMSGFLCLDPEVYLRKREPSLAFQTGCSASFVAQSHIHDDAGGSDSTYSMPNYVPISHHGNSRSQTLPVVAPANSDSQKNIVFIPVVASSLNALGTGSQPGLNMALADAAPRYGFVVPQGGGAGGERGLGSARCLAVNPQHPPVPRNDVRRLSGSATRLYRDRPSGRHLSGDSAREADEEETLIE